MRQHLSKLLSFAKTLGKHLWDRNKKKIIKKGFKILKQNVNNDKAKQFVGFAEHAVDDMLKKNIGIEEMIQKSIEQPHNHERYSFGKQHAFSQAIGNLFK